MRRALLALPALLCACGPYMTDGEYHSIHRAGADLPVWVRGNIDSGVFLVTIHGGPGHDGQGMVLSGGFQALEQDYAFVYWDQRASGMSQGNPSPDTFTLSHFVADTDAVLSLVQEAYAPDSLFVLGHSWGGDLALATALDGRQADAVDGWILHAGTHDEWFALDASRAWMAETIDGHLADGTDTAFWSEVKRWYADNPDLPPSDPRHFSYVSRTRGYYYDAENYEPPPVAELAFASPFSMALYQNEARSRRLCEALLDDFDMTDRLPEFDAPVLVLSGEHDGAVPLEVAEALHAGLGSEHKSLVVFEDVAHSAQDEDPDAFVAAMVPFMEGLR